MLARQYIESKVDNMLVIEERIRITGVIDSLGVRWEEAKASEKEDEASVLLEHYQSLILYLIGTGWRDYLPDGAEIPDEYMPIEYLEMLKTVQIE